VNLWDFCKTGAALAEKVEATRQSYDDTKSAILGACDMAEATVGRGILTARFIDRGVQMHDNLLEDAETNPPGIVKTASEVYKFLNGGNVEGESEER